MYTRRATSEPGSAENRNLELILKHQNIPTKQKHSVWRSQEWHLGGTWLIQNAFYWAETITWLVSKFAVRKFLSMTNFQIPETQLECEIVIVNLKFLETWKQALFCIGTSSQKLGRHASRPVCSVWKSLGRVNFGSKVWAKNIIFLNFLAELDYRQQMIFFFLYFFCFLQLFT